MRGSANISEQQFDLCAEKVTCSTAPVLNPIAEGVLWISKRLRPDTSGSLNAYALDAVGALTATLLIASFSS